MFHNRENLKGILQQSYEAVHTPTDIAKNLFLYIEYIGHAYCDKNYFISRKKYAHYLLMFVIDGKAAVSTSGIKYEVNPGQAFFIETQKPHSYGAINSLESLWVHLNGKHFQELFDYLIKVNGGHIFNIQDALAFNERFDRLFNITDSPSSSAEIIVSAELYSLVVSLIADSDRKKQSPIECAINYINKNFFQKITLKFLAEHCCMSASNFSKIFKDSTGHSPYQYIVNSRLHAARLYLGNSNDSIDNIAIIVGFSDSSAFISSFKKKYGITPQQYRKKIYS